MAKQVLCNECIASISENLSMDQVLILKYLKKEKTFNKNLSKDKLSIIPEIKGLTDFKFNFAMNGLELCYFVARNTVKRPNKYYITPDGKKALEIYEQVVRDNLSAD